MLSGAPFKCWPFALTLSLPCWPFALTLSLPCWPFALTLSLPCWPFALTLWLPCWPLAVTLSLPCWPFALTLSLPCWPFVLTLSLPCWPRRHLESTKFETIKAFLPFSHEHRKGFLWKCSALKVDLLYDHLVYWGGGGGGGVYFQPGKTFTGWGSEAVKYDVLSKITRPATS